MGKKKISCGLSESEINRAIRELEQYKREFMKKVELLREKVAQRLADEARTGFSGAVVDDLVKGGQKFADVKVSVDNRGNLCIPQILVCEHLIFARFLPGRIIAIIRTIHKFPGFCINYCEHAVPPYPNPLRFCRSHT